MVQWKELPVRRGHTAPVTGPASVGRLWAVGDVGVNTAKDQAEGIRRK